MDAWVFLLIAAAILGAGEIATTSFYLAPFALGAAAGGIVDLIGLGLVPADAFFECELVLKTGATVKSCRNQVFQVCQE